MNNSFISAIYAEKYNIEQVYFDHVCYSNYGYISNIYKKNKYPEISIIDGALISDFGIIINNKIVLESSLLGQNMSFEDNNAVKNFLDSINYLNIETNSQICEDLSSEITVCLNSWDHNYQHFLIETLPRIHIAACELNTPIAVSDYEFIKEILGIAYPDKSFIYISKGKFYKTNKAYLMSHVAKNFNELVEAQFSALNNLRGKLLDHCPSVDDFSYNIGFVGRFNVKEIQGKYRCIVNSEELLSCLLEHNIPTDDFMGKSLCQKSALCGKYNIHISPIGANLLNYLFAPKFADVYSVEHPYFKVYEWFSKLFNATNTPIHLHRLAVEKVATGSDNWANNLNSPYLIDMVLFKEFISSLLE